MRKSYYERVVPLIDKAFQIALKHRRYFHANPELSGQELNTSAYIARTLQEYGIENMQIYSNYGISALVEGEDTDFVIGLRAEMDALPIEEATGLEFSSTSRGVMHACGHDMHMAILLAFASIIAQDDHKPPVSIKLIFQPSEETLPGGAKQLIDSGVLNNPSVNCMLAFHVLPDLPVGHIGLHPGKYMASNDELFITLIGHGGHAAMPHLLRDPVLCAAQIITSLSQIIGRRSRPDIPSVLSFGRVIANGRTNVIPDIVEMEGTFRTFDENWRETAHKIIAETIDNIAQMNDVDAHLQIRKGYPALINNEKLTEIIKKLASDVSGKEAVHSLPIRTTADDFAFYSHIVPSCFIRLGVNTNAFTVGNLHTPLFNPDEKAMISALKLLAKLTENLHLHL